MSEKVFVKVKRLHPDAVIPRYSTEGSAGFDLFAVDEVMIPPGHTATVPLGIAFEIPPGYEIQIRMRSGIGLKTKLRQSNGVGTIDSDYRGEVSMIFDNINQIFLMDGVGPAFLGNAFYIDGTKVNEHNGQTEFVDGTYIIRKGDRVAQGVLQKVPFVEFVEVDELTPTKRGEGGFGSTGVM